MVLIDSVSRYVEGVLKEDSIQEESFTNGLLEYPQYTRPEVFLGERVPEVLLSGHHENIKEWRRNQSIINTYLKRPDLLKKIELSDKEQKMLSEYKNLKEGGSKLTAHGLCKLDTPSNSRLFAASVRIIIQNEFQLRIAGKVPANSSASYSAYPLPEVAFSRSSTRVAPPSSAFSTCSYNVSLPSQVRSVTA